MSKVSKGGDKDCKLFDISHSGSSNTTPTQCFVKECNICNECCVVPPGQIVVFGIIMLVGVVSYCPRTQFNYANCHIIFFHVIIKQNICITIIKPFICSVFQHGIAKYIPLCSVL